MRMAQKKPSAMICVVEGCFRNRFIRCLISIRSSYRETIIKQNVKKENSVVLQLQYITTAPINRRLAICKNT
jgi:hypothetical protein